jgi:tetratricopeptide (TPR) repeat protein
LALAEELLAAYPDSARSHYSYALSAGNLALFVGGGDKVRLGKEIKDSLDRALALDPDLVDAYRVRGVYFYELATLGRLLRIFAKILYGGVPRGTLEDAAADFEQAIAREPHSLFAYYHLAKTRYAQRNYAEAQRLCAQVETLPDSDGQDPVTRREAAELEKKAAKKIKQRRNRRG